VAELLIGPEMVSGVKDGHGDGREGRVGQEAGRDTPSFVNRSSPLTRCLASAWLAVLTKCLGVIG